MKENKNFMKRYFKPFNIILLFAGVVVLLSLVSYNPADNFYPHHVIHNFMGLLGAKVSSFLLSNFGVAAYFVPIFLMLSTFSLAVSSAKFVRAVLFAFIFLIIADVVLYVLVPIDRQHMLQRGFYLCGSGGYTIGPVVRYILGRVGVFVIVVPLGLVVLYFTIKEPLLMFLSLLRLDDTDKKKRSTIKRKKKQKSFEDELVEKIMDDEGPVATVEEPAVEEQRELEPSDEVVYEEAEGVDSESEKQPDLSQKPTIAQKPTIERQVTEEKKQKSNLKAPKGRVEKKTSDGYELPSLELLEEPISIQTDIVEDEIYKNARLLEEKLKNFGVEGRVVNVRPGPVVTMYEFKPKSGIKISKIANLYNDLAMAMKAISVRIVAPIPGKAVVGIEISNPKRETVYMREILSSRNFINSHSKLTLALGKDIVGNSFVTDLSKMPHLLIAGATGSGKSVAVNAMIISILYKATPQDVRFVMIDPKMLELSIYDGIPHMLMPVVVDPKEASGSLAALVSEMETRYKMMSEVGVRNIDGFNAKAKRGLIEYSRMPYIVVVIDELADLMMVAGKKVETHIARLAQMARAAGIHMIVATQRPSVDVLTGLIKANFPARISFKVSSKVDSRTILDTQGAETLLGRGDMLFLQPGSSSLVRVHGAFISDDEIKRVTDFVKSQGSPEYNEELINATKEASGIKEDEEIELDEMFEAAVEIIREGGSPTISYIQRKLKIGYNRAARIVEQMEKKGILSKPDERGKREVLI